MICKFPQLSQNFAYSWFYCVRVFYEKMEFSLFYLEGQEQKKGFTRKSSNTVTALNWNDTVLAIKLQLSYWFNYHTFIQHKLNAFFFLVSPLTELSKHCWWWRIAWARWFSGHIFAVTARTSWWTPRSCKCWQARCSSTISSHF